MLEFYQTTEIVVNNMKYEITNLELKCINILIRTVQEAINRNTFTNEETQKIINTIDKLNQRNK